MRFKRSFFVALMTTLACMVNAADFTVPCRVQRQAYPLLADGKNIKLAAELSIGVYPDGTTMSRIERSLSRLSEEKRLTVPEYLIINEFKLTLSADRNAILANYWDKPAKKYAGDVVFREIEKTQDYNVNNVKDLLFLTKAVFGPYVRIKYKRLAKKANTFSPSWASILRKHNGRYYFVYELEQSHIFHTLAGGFPYWKAEGERQVSIDDKFLKANFVYKGDAPDTNYEESKLTLLYQLDRFEEKPIGPNEPATKGPPSDLVNFLARVSSVYREGTDEQIVSLWAPNRQKTIKLRMAADSIGAQESKKFFMNAGRLRPIFLIGTEKECFVYIQPAGADAAEGLKLLRLTRTAGKLYLTDRVDSFLADRILSSNMMENVLRAQLQHSQQQSH